MKTSGKGVDSVFNEDVLKIMVAQGLQRFLQTEVDSVMGNFLPRELGDLNRNNGIISLIDSGSSASTGSSQSGKAYVLTRNFLR